MYVCVCVCVCVCAHTACMLMGTSVFMDIHAHSIVPTRYKHTLPLTARAEITSLVCITPRTLFVLTPA